MGYLRAGWKLTSLLHSEETLSLLSDAVNQGRVILFNTKAPSAPASAWHVGIEQLYRSGRIRRIFLLFRGENPRLEVIMSRLKVSFPATTARFSVVSKRPGLILICASYSNETADVPPLKAA